MITLNPVMLGNKAKLAIAIVLAAGILVLAGWCAGSRHGTVNEKLAQNTIVTKAHDSVTSSDSVKAIILGKVDSSKEVASNTSLASHNSGKSHVIVTGPSGLTVNGVNTTVDTAVVNRIKRADSTIVTLNSTVIAKDNTINGLQTVISDQRTQIKDRDNRIGILEREHNPRTFHGIGIGVGACSSGSMVPTPCINVSYSIGIRFP